MSAKLIRYVTRTATRGNPWGNFEWLARETEKYLKLEEGQAEFTEPTVQGPATT